MFERYTEKARRVIFFARYEASQFGSPAIEPEHLLLGLMREDPLLFSTLLTRGKSSLKFVREEVARKIPTARNTTTSIDLPLAAATKRALAYAHEESVRLQHRHIGTEHLLMGLLKEEGTVARDVLKQEGLELKTLRRHVASSIGTETGLPRLGSVFSNLRTVLDPKPRRKNIVLGIEALLSARSGGLRDQRVGLVCNQASVDHKLRHVADLMHQHADINLTALFSPQHGIRGDVQDNMVETAHGTDAVTGLPIYSLYSETREPTEEMLKDVDVIVFDLQDVGCRIYTFIYTMANCMRAARKLGKRVIVCDRPNPINGISIAGNILEEECASFVGQFPIPVRHGMTVGELALMFNSRFGLGCDLDVIPMRGWARDLWFDETDVPWVMPSPNMPTLDTATVFPGTVFLEGTMISEGRGTTRPFEIVGAPYIEAETFAKRLNTLDLPGVYFRPCGFLPTFQKHSGLACGGVQIHVLDREVFEPVISGIAIVRLAHELYPDKFQWKRPPYEYVYDRNPFDVIAGTAQLRESIEKGLSLDTIEMIWKEKLKEFDFEREKYLMY